MLILLLLTLLASILFYYFLVKPLSYWKDRGVKQMKPILIFRDNGLMVSKSFGEFVDTVYKACPGVRYSGMYQFCMPILILKDPDLIKQITVKDFEHFTDHRSLVPEEADPLWAKNLFALRGNKWRDMRSILSPSFTSSKMRVMFFLISECAENFVQHFLNKNEDVVTIEFKDTFTRFTNDVIATTAFGIKIDSLEEPNNRFYLMGKEATDFSGFWKNFKFLGYLLLPKVFNLLKIPLFSKELNSFFREIISETIKARKEKGIIRPDMIHLLMEARKGIAQQEENEVIDTGFSTAQETDLGKPKEPKQITDLDITAQAMIFFFAGFDTVSGLMCFLAYELAANPDVQNRLRKEISTTLEDCGGKLTYEGLLNMNYMDMVVSETLRKWPNATILDRVCTKPYTIQPTNPEENPLHLKEGDVIWLPVYGIHRDAEYYPDPERFDPERFSEENKANIKPYTYFPFGLGPRNCIGSRFALLETKTVIFHILTHFELVPVEKSTIPLKLCKKEINLMSEGGFWFGLKRIKA